VTTLLAVRPGFTADHEVFRDSARRFVATEVVPHLDDWRTEGSVPRTVFAAAGGNGFLGTAVPDQFGGGDAEDYGFLAVLIEETVAAGATGLAVLWALHAGVTIPAVLDHGTPADRLRWLPPLVAGDQIGLPAPGPTVAGLVGAHLADLLVVQHHDGVVLLPVATSGVRVAPVPGGLAAPEAGGADIAVESPGMNTSPIPGAAASVGRDIDLWFAVVALAGARRAIALALDYVGSRRVFGKMLADFENTRMRLAEIAAELTSTTTYVDRCLTARAAATLTVGDAAAARHVAVSLSDRAADQSLQLHGGYGYMREYPIAQAFADARFLRTAGQLYSDPRHAVAAELFNDR
jgi:alkylation response protein AidB-like acyl-CoA dehydrogenase